MDLQMPAGASMFPGPHHPPYPRSGSPTTPPLLVPHDPAPHTPAPASAAPPVTDGSGAAAVALLERGREVLGLTFRELAATLPVHESTVYRWRRGKSPTPAVGARLGMLRRVVARVAAVHPAAVQSGWIDAANPDLGGRTPRQVLLEGRFDRMLELLRGDGAVRTGATARGGAGTRDALVEALRREQAAAQASARWAQFLAGSTADLAEAVGLEDTLGRVDALVVPALADFCETLLLGPSGTGRSDEGEGEQVLESASIGALDPDLRATVAGWSRGERIAVDGGTPLGRVVREREAILLTSDPEIQLFTQENERMAALVAAGLRSLMMVPLVARGRVLGVMVCGQCGREQRFTAADLELGQEFARIAAIGIDNALLLEEAERARMAAEAANRAKSDFLSMMSHELRTPLNAILGFASLLGDGIAGPVGEGQRNPIDRINASANHLLSMIEELLEYARLEVVGDREIEVDSHPVDVFRLTRDTAAMIEPAAAMQRLALRVEVPAGGHVIRSDARRIRQILLNLLNNAIRFTHRGEVVVRARVRDDGRVELQVQDTGIGIAREHQQRIFEPFWQVDQSSTRAAGGTGLGLAITRQLAELLGAELGLESALGEGTTFTVVIPAAIGERRRES